MQYLLTHLCNTFVGAQYSKLVSILHPKPQSLEALVELSEEGHKHLIEKMKYLIKLNVVVFEKSKGVVVYSVNEGMILFFQRVVKYNDWLEEHCTKDESRIMRYFLKTLTSNLEGYLKSEEIKQEQIERTKQIFVGLVKKGYLYEDERALDLQLCTSKEENQETTDKQGTPSTQNKVNEVKPEIKTKRKKKEIKIQKTEGPLQPEPNTESSVPEKLVRSTTFFCLSISFLFTKIQDHQIAIFLKNKFSLDTALKSLVENLHQSKYKFPFDFYNEHPLQPRQNLLKDIQSQLLEEYINLKYGQSSLLVFKTLLDKEYITEKNLLKLTMLDLKPLRYSINQLYVAGIVKSVELRIEKSNTMVFWVDMDIALNDYLVFLCKTVTNLHIVNTRFREQVLKNVTKGVACEELAQRILRIEANLLEMDDCLILYNH